MLICIYAKNWLLLVEQKTDDRIDFERSEELFDRVSTKARNEADER